MRDIIRKIGMFFEAHVEKVVFGIVGVVCMILLYKLVVFSPNTVVYEGEKFKPGEIDHYIEQEASELRTGLNRSPEPIESYKWRLNGPIGPNDPVRDGIAGNLSGGFVGLFDSALGGILDTRTLLPIPSYSSADVVARREYKLPRVGEVSDVTVEHIRTVAYVPTVEINEQVTYENATNEANDIDLVTVEAKYDVAALYDRFHESFASEFLPEQWRDPCLAKPVFAAVQLQRQELLEEDSWSEWQDVPRSRIDSHKMLFEIVEDIGQLRGGVKVRLLQFNNPEIRIDLLQPTSYQIASAKEEWFPPSLHKKYIELRKKEELEEKRVAREEERDERRRELEDRRGERYGGTSTGSRYGTGAGSRSPYGDVYGGAGSTYGDRRSSSRTRRSRTERGAIDRGGLYEGGRLTGRDRTSRRRSRDDQDMDYLYMAETGAGAEGPKKSALDEVLDEFYEIQLDYRTNLAELDGLVFWAYDDTVQPMKTYRYRIRLGVFNPVAGTKHLSEQYLSEKDQLILWSEFSDITEEVTIAGRMYFFAQDIQESAKTVTVEVAKYVLGYWYSQEFLVNPGELIGKEVENEPAKSERTLRGEEERFGALYVASQDRSLEPKTIDYSTGAVMVDAVLVSDWLGAGAGQLSRRNYFNMLYSLDRGDIEQTPIRPRNWDTSQLNVSNEIKRAQKEEKEPLRTWNSSTVKRRPTYPERYEGMEGAEYEAMLRQMMAD